MNKNIRIYPGSVPSCRGNSPTSSGLILMKIDVTESEQRARLIRI
jgi:hypothetical protein